MTDPTPAEALKAGEDAPENYEVSRLPLLLREHVDMVLACEAEPHVIEDARAIVAQAADYIAAALSPPDAGEVRTYREVEDALATVPDGWSWSLGQMMGLPENMRYRCFLSDHNTPDGKATQHVQSDKPTIIEAIRVAVSQAAAIRKLP